MDPRAVLSSLIASKLRIVLTVVLVASVGIGGAFAVGVLGVPELAAIDNTFGNVTDETTTIETDLVVSNPNPIGVSIDDISVEYTVSMNSIEMANGTRDGVSIGSGNSTIGLETQLQNEAIPPWWTSHIQNGERTTVGIDAIVRSGRLDRSTDLSRSHEIQTDLLTAFNSDEPRPVNANSPITGDPVLYVNKTRAEWGSVSDSETPIDMEFDVYNPNLEPYAITRVGYDITMNGVAMGDGETRTEHVIESYGTETVPLTTTIDNRHLDEWWVTHLDEDIHGHQESELRIEFYAVIELPSGETITVPLDRLTHQEEIVTDIFDEGGDFNGSADDGDGEDESDGDGSDDRDTQTPTDEGSESSTETPSDTDSNGGGESTDEDSDGDGSEDDDGGVLPV